MAARKKNRDEWTATGSFVNKPQRGWLHPDSQLLPDAGVCYGVRYIGCMEVKVSMKTLDFATRTAIAKESISKVCEAAGLKIVAKRKKDKKVTKYIGEHPLMHMAGSNVNLTITTESLSMMVMESGEIIAEHQMPGISFASGGDPDTMDFVAYVAKDPVNGRVCYVLECGGGLAQDVITTIGQAFELRFKQYLNTRPTAVDINKENESFGGGDVDSWGNEADYYNDQGGAEPPQPKLDQAEAYSAPSNIPLGMYKSMKEEKETVYDNREGNLMSFEEPSPNVYDNPKKQDGAVGGQASYDNPRCLSMMGVIRENSLYDNKGAAAAGAQARDPFNMEPFCNTLPHSDINGATGGTDSDILDVEPWFHGKMSRQQAESLLGRDGDFLVRESSNTTGQYVLSGMHNDRVKHLLLVDPSGVVRTKDKTFDSVSHLVNYHMNNGLPICSQDSELLLKRPVVHSAA